MIMLCYNCMAYQSLLIIIKSIRPFMIVFKQFSSYPVISISTEMYCIHTHLKLIVQKA